MKKNINTKKENNVMKRLSILFTLLLFSILNVNALTMSFNQNENIFDFENAEKGNNVFSTHASNINTAFQNLNGTNFTYDYKLELSEINQEFYIALENFFVNSSYKIFFHGDLSKDDTLYVQDLVLNEQGTYILKFIPTGIEAGQIFINLDENGGSGVFGATYIEEKPKGFNDLIGGLVDTFSTVFDINVKLWFLLYYLIIFMLSIGFMSMLFGFASFIFKKAQDIKGNKGKYSNKRDSED